MKRYDKKIIRNSIAIGLLLVVILYTGYNFFHQKSQADVVDEATSIIESAVENDHEKYITLNMSDDLSLYSYQLQLYGEGKSYYIFNSSSEGVDFSSESYCDGTEEYVKSNYTDGFELLGMQNCAQRTYTLNYGINGFDLSHLTQNDFDVSKSKGVTKLTVKKDSLSNKIFLGDFATENNVEVKKVVITSSDDITTLSLDFNHSLYGDISLSLSVEETKKLDIPEYK